MTSSILSRFLPLIGCLVFSPVNAQDFVVSTLTRDLRDDLQVYRIDIASNRVTPIYTPRSHCAIVDYWIQIAPQRNLIGMIETCGDASPVANPVVWPRRLIALEKTGRVLKKIEGVQRFSWSPNGAYIACILGEDTEGFGFVPSDLVVVNTSTWKQKIIGRRIRYTDVSWAAFDSMIYVTDYHRVYRVNPESGLTEKTERRGIFFSPNGKYYYNANYEGGSFAVFDAMDDRVVTPSWLEEKTTFVNSHRWIGGTSVLVAGDITKSQKVVDIATGKLLASFPGYFVGFDSRTGDMLRYDPGDNRPSTRLSRVKSAK